MQLVHTEEVRRGEAPRSMPADGDERLVGPGGRQQDLRLGTPGATVQGADGSRRNLSEPAAAESDALP